MKQAKLRVLVTADAVGGVWQYSVDLARGLSGLSIETVLVVLGPSPSPAQLKMASAIDGLTLIDTGLPLDWLADTSESIRTAGEAVARLAETHSADIVQLNGAALAAEAKFPVPVVAVAHSCIATWWQATKGTEPDGAFKWRAELTGEGLKASDHVVAPTAAFAEATQRAYALETKPTAVHNGRSPFPLPRVAPHDFAFTAGRLWDKGKNVETLDAAAGRLAVPLYAAGPDRGPNGDGIDLQHARGLGNLGEEELARWIAARPKSANALHRPSPIHHLAAPPRVAVKVARIAETPVRRRGTRPGQTTRVRPRGCLRGSGAEGHGHRSIRFVVGYGRKKGVASTASFAEDRAAR